MKQKTGKGKGGQPPVATRNSQPDPIELPRGWRVLFTWQSLIGSLLSAVLGAVVVIGMILLTDYLPMKVASFLSPRFDKLEGKLDNHAERLVRLEEQTKLLDGTVRTLLRDRFDVRKNDRPRQIEEKLASARSFLASAREAGAVIGPSEVVQIGQRLLEGQQENPRLAESFWLTFLQVLGYRSFLDSKLRPAPVSQGTTMRTCIQVGERSVGTRVDNSVISDCRQELDRVSWKHVLFRRAVIVYSGGPIKLEDVRFEDCLFEISLTPAGKKVGETLLASSQPVIQIP